MVVSLLSINWKIYIIKFIKNISIIDDPFNPQSPPPPTQQTTSTTTTTTTLTSPV